MPTWLSRNNFTPSDYANADDLNNLANDDRTWGGNVNGGGYLLSNVILQGSGGFQYLPSPVQVTPSAAGSSCLQLDQTVGTAPSQTQVARWTVCKDGTAETGGNVGSNFAIARYTDAGALIDTPITINRATGLITMGAQQWAGAINGGGQTLSNVVIPGVLADPTTTKGDILARSASALARVPIGADGFILTASSASASGVTWAAAPATGVPTSRKINTGAGLSGGGDLTADRTIVGVVFGPSGASHSAGDVPDPGATAQATRYLREDATWDIPSGTGGGMTDPTTTKGDLIVRGSGTTRLGVGADGQALVADSTQALGVKWGTVAGGSGSQTPWASNIDGAGHNLSGVGALTANTLTAIGGSSWLFGGAKSSSGALATFTITSSDASPLQALSIIYGAANPRFAIGFVEQSIAWRNITLCETGGSVGIGTPTPGAKLTISGPGSNNGGACDVQIVGTGTIGAGINLTSSDTGGRNWAIISSGSASGAGALGFFDATAGSYAIWITPAHNVGIGTPAPLRKLHVGSVPLGGGAAISGAAPSLMITNADTEPNTNTASIGIGLATASNQFGLPNAGDSIIFTIGSARGDIYINSNYSGGGALRSILLQPNGGNVGIGTAAPSSLLSVIPVTTPTTAAQGIQLEIGEATNNPQYSLTLGYFTDAGIGKGTIQAIHSGSGAASALLLNPSGGNVGIGTTAPAGLFHANAASGNLVSYFSCPVGSGSYMEIGILGATVEISSSPAGDFALGHYGAAGGVLQSIRAGSVVNTLVMIGGKVGIAKASPAYALDVTGDVNCTGAFRVNGAAIGGGGPSAQALNPWFGTPTASRQTNGTYQNTYAVPLYVSVACTIPVGSIITAVVGATSPPQSSVGMTQNTSQTATMYGSLFFIVLPGYYYGVVTSGSVATLSTWAEWK